MVLESVVIPRATHNLLRRLTGESRPDIALSLALKDLVRLRTESAEACIANFEKKYSMNFRDFEEAWKGGKIEDAYSYPVEQEYLEWEATVTDLEALQEIVQWLA
jgi:hypothetical protein